MPIELLLVAGIVAAMVAAAVYLMVEKMTASPDIAVRRDLAPRIIAAVPPDLAKFLDANEFRFVEAYAFHTIHFGIWAQDRSSPPSRLISFSLSAKGANHEFITEFSDEDSLTTTRTSSAFMFPRPFGSFLQSFPNAPIDRLWDLHTRGEQHLISALSLQVTACRISFVDGFRLGVLRQMACVRSLPLWPLRGVYWFLLKRFLMQNRAVWTQNIGRLYKKTPSL